MHQSCTSLLQCTYYSWLVCYMFSYRQTNLSSKGPFPPPHPQQKRCLNIWPWMSIYRIAVQWKVTFKCHFPFQLVLSLLWFSAYISHCALTTMYAFYRQVKPPTGVENAIYCNFISKDEKNLIVTKATELTVYRILRNPEVS